MPTYEITTIRPSATRGKIQAIKDVRAATGLGLKEAKDLVDDALGGAESPLPYRFNGPLSVPYAYFEHIDIRVIEPKCEIVPGPINTLATVASFLRHYSPNLTVCELANMLEATCRGLGDSK